MNIRRRSGIGMSGALPALAVWAAAMPGTLHCQALDEVVVTAQKREQNLQDVPMSITALGAPTLERMGAQEFFDYATRVPNLSFSYGTSGQLGSQSIAIRGVVGRGTTGFYIDDTPVPESMNPAVSDIERIEVLRGPQGTLYGARSMGGTVRLITRQPDLAEFAGSGRAMVSTTREGGINYTADAAYNFVLAPDRAAVRASAYVISEEGLYDRVAGLQPSLPANTPLQPFSTHENVDDTRTVGGQVSGLVSLLDGRLRIRPRIALQELETDGFSLADSEPGNFEQVRLFDLGEPGRDRWGQYSLTFDFDAGIGEITSSTAWLDREFSNREDYSELAILLFGTPPAPLLIRADNDLERFAHETRFASSFDGPLSLTAGVFFSDTTDRRIFPESNTIPGIDDYFGGIFGTDVLYSERRRTDTRELALFGELSWAISERLTALVGARWFDNEVEFESDQFGIAVSPDSFAGKQTERKVNPKFLLQYSASDDVELYASAAQGFRTGGVNSFSNLLCAGDLQTAGLTSADVLTYDSDTLWNYELGLKSALAGGTTTFNVAAFDIDWQDVQQIVPLQSCGFLIVLNAGEARSRGFELELDSALTDRLSASLGVGYTDSEITDGGGLSFVRTGVPLQHVPEWTGTAAAEYRFALAGRDGYVRADYSYVGSSTSANNDAVNRRPREGYSLVNLRAGLSFESLELSLFVNNVADEHANLSDIPPLALELPGRSRLVTNRPRTLGIEARVRF